MVEVLVASAFVAGGVMAAARLGQPIHARRLDPMGFQAHVYGDDLPCPWCNTATSEADTHCPGCRQRFG